MHTTHNRSLDDKEKLNAKVEAFQKSIIVAAEFYMDKRSGDEKDHTMSPELEFLFAQRQIAKDEGWYDLTKSYTNKIRRRLKKERLDKSVSRKGLWYDIKKAKSNFVPSHTKFKRQDGTVCASNERPDILADHFEQRPHPNC